MTEFTPLSGALGGLLIGLGVALFLLLSGRIAGISGILGGALDFGKDGLGWRLAFLVGLVLGPLALGFVVADVRQIAVTSSLPLLIAGGFLVGFGTRLGKGCTSGHGLCGLARFSPRSVVATATFFGVAALTVFITRHVIGG